MPLPREQKPSVRQRQRPFKLPPMKPDIAVWSRAARFPLQSTIRSRPHRMRHKPSSLLPRLRSRLPETRRPAIGSTAYATLYGSTTRIPVRLRQLSGAADAQTRTFEARYVLAGAAANAPLGATVTVHLSGDAGTDMLQVPVASVLDQGKGPGIWLLNPSTSTVSFQPVQIRQVGEELATISGNVHTGQQVVALGVHLLRDGERVRVENKAEIQ